MRHAPIALITLASIAGCATPSLQIPYRQESAVRSGASHIAPSAVEGPVVAGCHVFPTPNPAVTPAGNDWFNQDVSHYPLDPRSKTYIAKLAGSNLHPDFGHAAYYGIPINIVPQNQKLVPVTFHYKSQSDPGPYPIPPSAQIEGQPKYHTGDRHVLVLQRGTCKLYELFAAVPENGGKSWKAGSGAIFDLNSTKLRPNGWTSADAAGLPIMPALIKCAEVKAGAIDHAMRVTFSQTQSGFIHPATHLTGSNRTGSLPPMGLRLRLKASYDLSKFNTVSRIILTAMKKYGLLVADNGSPWYFQGQGGSAASCWNNNQLDQLKNVPGSAFEVVKTGPILR